MQVERVDNALFKAHRSHQRLLHLARLKANEATNINPYSTTCKTCLIHLQLLDSSSYTRAERRLSPSAYQTQGICSNHIAIFPPTLTRALVEEVVLTKPAKQKLMYVRPDPYRNDQSTSLGAPWELSIPNTAVPLFSLSSESPQPRLVDREWIDLNMLKQWLHECAQNHTGSCAVSDPQRAVVPASLLLIDCVQKCLVRLSYPCRYVALSYVWGHTNTFVTTKANYESLCTPNALASTGPASVRLPRTLHQSIELIVALGERFLWIDALCIVQDDESLMNQLNEMALLFANASLTIVAASSQHADAGFRGLPNISPPRDARQYIAALDPEQHLVRPSSKHVWDDSLLHPWSTRAWTFQEAICSRRMLYFANNSVRWSCQTARWSEESNSTDCTSSYSTVEQRQLSLTSPKLSTVALPTSDEYISLVNGYNVRTLTYAPDALAAFAGVAMRLGEKFVGGLISGLPEVFFDVFLLWQPLRRIGTATLREKHTSLAKMHLPTWSWAAWTTEIALPCTWIRHRDPAGPLPLLLGPIRPFYQIKISYTDKDGHRVAINSTWLDFASSALDNHLPPGWTSREMSNSPDIREYGLSTRVKYFLHHLDPSLQFWFPVPLADSPEPPLTLKQLHFQTQSGHFRLGECRRATTQIHNLTGEPVGTLFQHDEADPGYIEATSGRLGDRPTIELIAIFGCAVPKNDQMMQASSDAFVVEVGEHGKEPPKIEDVYNVIWVVWDTGVAYRKATGIVKKRFWEENKPKTVDVVLG